MPRFAANLSMMFTEVPFPQRFAAAAHAGFTAVEFLFPYDHSPADVSQWLRDNSLESVLFNFWPGDWAAGERGLAALPRREAQFRESVARALEYAEALDTPCLHAMAGVVPVAGNRSDHRDVFVQNLRYAARELAKHDRMLLIEAINPRDMPGYFLTTQADAHAIREEVGEPNLMVLMDFYHAQVMGGDLTMIFKQHVTGIGHVQIAGVPNRHEPDEGEVDYGHVLRLLDALHYQGWVGCEYRPRARTEDGLGWLAPWGKPAGGDSGPAA